MFTRPWSSLLLAASLLPTAALAEPSTDKNGFFEGAEASVLLRHTYWNRDWKDGVDDVNTWAQGVIATFSSGFTEGPVGFGVDAFGLLGIRLDGGQNDMFPNRDKHREDSLGQAGAALKARLSQTTLSVGQQMPTLPVLYADDSRLLPQSFTGALLTSQEIEGLQLDLGRFTQDSPLGTSARDAGHLDRIEVVGGRYQVNPQLSAALYASWVQDVYRKKYLGLSYALPLAERQALSFDFNYYRTAYASDTIADRYFGNGILGDDNQLWSLSARYSHGAHAYILAYQENSGDVGYAYGLGDGTGAIWVANSYLADFNNKDEHSVQASYELDFADYGVPGLSWKTAYVYGYNIDIGTNKDAQEREIFNQVSYEVQSGPAKDLKLRARNSILRGSNGLVPDGNEWRLFVEYPLELL